LTLGQEFSGYVAQLHNGVTRVEQALPSVLEIAQGGTAVGTGLNTFKGFDQKVADNLTTETGYKFIPAANKFESLASKDALI